MTDDAGVGIDELLKNRRGQILELAAKYGVANVRVFGSVARGEAGADSDIDLLVDIRPDTGLELMTFGNDLEDLLGREVDVIPASFLRASLRRKVLLEAVPL